MTFTEMIVHDKQTTNYVRLTVFKGKLRIVDIENPTTEEISFLNANYPFASATYVNPDEIRFFI